MTTPDQPGGVPPPPEWGGQQGSPPPPPEWGGQPGPPAVPGWSGGGAPPQTNPMAVGALVASILGFFCGVGFIIGLILGYNARKQIRASGEGGEGAATAAIVIGWIGVGLMVLGVILVAVFAFFVALAPGVMG